MTRLEDKYFKTMDLLLNCREKNRELEAEVVRLRRIEEAARALMTDPSAFNEEAWTALRTALGGE